MGLPAWAVLPSSEQKQPLDRGTSGMAYALRFRFLVVLWMATTAGLFPALAAADDSPKQFDIPAGELGYALRDFGRQANQQILFSTDLVRGKSTNGVKGWLTPSTALDQLLAGSGLITSRSADGSLMVFAVGAKEGSKQSDPQGESAGKPKQSPSGSQSPPQQGPAAPNKDSDQPISQSIGLEEILVTGSRLIERQLDAPTPTTTVTAHDIEASGVTSIADIVNRIPALGVPFGRYSQTGGADETGTSVLNLRNLGAQRTLVLINGERQVSSVINTSEVDTFTIPTILVKRVDVSTGGASVAYGADAVTGVVNFIMKDSFDGAELQTQYGQTAPYHDGRDKNIAALLGRNFADGRGNATLALSWDQTGQIEGLDRKWDYYEFVYGPNPAYQGQPGTPVQIGYSPAIWNITNSTGILFGTDTGQEYTFNKAGQLAPYNVGNQIGSTGFSTNGGGEPAATFQQIENPSRRWVADGRMHFDFAAGQRAFATFNFADVSTRTNYQDTGVFGVFVDPTYSGVGSIITPNNPFLPRDPLLTTFFAANPDGVVLSKLGDDTGLRQFVVDRKTYQSSAGLQGTLPFKDFTYKAFVQYGRTDSDFLITNDYLSSRYFLAFNAVTDTAGVVPGDQPGAPACAATVAAYTASSKGSTDPDVNACKPLNLFGFGNESQAALNYIHTNLDRKQSIEQQMAAVRLNGTLFSLPAGPVSTAAGVEWRRESSQDLPDATYIAGNNYDGQIFPSGGHYSVYEAYLETVEPLLADLPGAKELRLEDGVRFSHYDDVGNTTTWRGGLVWAPVQDLRLRSEYAVAVRAPNIGELFAPNIPTFFGVTDPCDGNMIAAAPNPALRATNCQALGLNGSYHDPLSGIAKPGEFSGNAQLVPEQAQTLTAGAVLQPRFVPRLVITADWYRINLTKAIEQQNAQDILNACVDNFASINNPYCALITRSTTNGRITNIKVTNLNVASIETRGVDLSTAYSVPLRLPRIDNAGTLNVQLSATWLGQLDSVGGVGAHVVSFVAATGAPRWKGNLFTSYERGPLEVNWTAYGSSKAFFAVTNPSAYSPAVLPSQAFHDVRIRWRAGFNTDFYLGVNNLFNAQPRYGFVSFPISDTSARIGRFMYVGAKAHF
jgi:outer membrane receptor protein involved in Fe transport